MTTLAQVYPARTEGTVAAETVPALPRSQHAPKKQRHFCCPGGGRRRWQRTTGRRKCDRAVVVGCYHRPSPPPSETWTAALSSLHGVSSLPLSHPTQSVAGTQKRATPQRAVETEKVAVVAALHPRQRVWRSVVHPRLRQLCPPWTEKEKEGEGGDKESDPCGEKGPAHQRTTPLAAAVPRQRRATGHAAASAQKRRHDRLLLLLFRTAFYTLLQCVRWRSVVAANAVARTRNASCFPPTLAHGPAHHRPHLPFVDDGRRRRRCRLPNLWVAAVPWPPPRLLRFPHPRRAVRRVAALRAVPFVVHDEERCDAQSHSPIVPSALLVPIAAHASPHE